MQNNIIDLQLQVNYFDLLELIMLIEDSENEDLLHYAEDMKKVFNEHSGI